MKLPHHMRLPHHMKLPQHEVASPHEDGTSYTAKNDNFNRENLKGIDVWKTQHIRTVELRS